MNRFLLLIVLWLSALSAYAQTTDLEDVFDGDVVPREEMVETFLKGSRIAPYHLTEFHSVKFFASEAQVAVIAAAVMEDADEAVEKETVYVGGKLSYAILVFRKTREWDDREYNRFVCFQLTEGEGARPMVTLVEMKGDAQLEDLKSIFGTNENN